MRSSPDCRYAWETSFDQILKPKMAAMALRMRTECCLMMFALCTIISFYWSVCTFYHKPGLISRLVRFHIFNSQEEPSAKNNYICFHVFLTQDLECPLLSQFAQLLCHGPIKWRVIIPQFVEYILKYGIPGTDVLPLLRELGYRQIMFLKSSIYHRKKETKPMNGRISYIEVGIGQYWTIFIFAGSKLIPTSPTTNSSKYTSFFIN